MQKMQNGQKWQEKGKNEQKVNRHNNDKMYKKENIEKWTKLTNMRKVHQGHE